MVTTERLDPDTRAEVARFVDLPFRLYRDDPNWVPPLRRDAALLLNRRRHPFYEHSDAAFFLALRHRRIVGRIGAVELRPYNRAHDVRHVSFTLFDCEDDAEAAGALFGRVFEWAQKRKLDRAAHLSSEREAT